MPRGLSPKKEDSSSDDGAPPDVGGKGGKLRRPAAAADGAADMPPKKKTRKSAAETEAEMMAKYMATKEKRAKERADKRKTELLKRPAAAAPKKTAKLGKVGKALAIKYKVKWEAGDEHRSRNVFNCKHYNRAKTAVKASFPKAKEEDTKATLADVVAKSSKVYDKHNA